MKRPAHITLKTVITLEKESEMVRQLLGEKSKIDDKLQKLARANDWLNYLSERELTGISDSEEKRLTIASAIITKHFHC